MNQLGFAGSPLTWRPGMLQHYRRKIAVIEHKPEPKAMQPSFWEEVDRARRLTPQQRSLGTLDLIDLVYNINVAGIRHYHPDADDARVREILVERRRIIRKLESAA
jgi:hypothetical protein